MRSLVISSRARKVITISARVASTANSSSKRQCGRRLSSTLSSLILSVIEKRSKSMVWSIVFLARSSTAWNASSSLNTPIGASCAGPSTVGASIPRANTSRPRMSRPPSCSAASLYFWYSSRRRMSSARGSSSSTSSASSSAWFGSGGSSIRDLMWVSVAAITRYSAATSMFRSVIRRRYSLYFCAMNPMGISRMSSSCCWIRCSSRSNGPSNVGS